ncbi:hypothetical protein HJX10_09535 [Klebsiella pneumoniae]|uniref:hypothetical protein n=1 Tax=Klebsiella TaxID=570 RepID=UPI00094B2541|nr:hypothetical protein [Klebsiella pneumoniae]MBC4342450.1 hypothetical protein [Klebsiella pneumoniae]MCW0275965.1 hypothetical protein [Klebsiella pneumoniae]MDA4022216.1 hypothetical protein [Klebsiella pneumoniae]MDR4579265.1 hypothetical protein [Klebsiella pneumoniae]MDZ2558712.1 hypothetical protein [Klebsiella pneumoniae]
MTDTTELALLFSKAKASVFTLEYISQFEPADIDSDDVDLRFEVDGRDTGTNVSIVDECGQAARVIGALVEALEKAQQRITQMESRTVTDWIEHDGKWRPESLGLDELVYLKTRKQELKIPYPAGKVKGWMNTGGDMDVMAYKLASPQASTVTVKLTDINEYLAEVHDKTLNRALRLLAEGVRAGDVAAMRAAGIKVEDE